MAQPFFFSVVEAESAVTVCFIERICSADPATVPLISIGQSLHDGLHAIEGGLLVKYILIAPFS